MTKDKQIEELTRVMCQSNRDGICGYDRKPCRFDCGSYQIATKVYTTGYRKSTEMAREIFEEIEKSFIEYYDKTITYSSPTLPYRYREAVGFSLNEMFMKIAELKKKYTESEKK